MKETLSLIFMFFILLSNAQETAKVSKINGVEVYILSEPVRKYDVVMGQGNSIQWTSLVSGGLINDNIATKVTKFVRAVQDKALSFFHKG